MSLSIIVPVGNRHSDIGTLYRDYHASLTSLGVPFEFIFVLDGPLDLARSLQPIGDEGRLTVVGLTRPFGEATALMAGFQRARGDIIVTLPAYHQIEPVEIRKLIAALDKADLAIGHRWPRAGSRWESLRRDVFHGLIARVTGQRFRDLGCGARAMKRRVLEEIPLYGDQHRFLPVLANRHGFRVVEVDLRQSPLDRYDGGYRAREYLHRILDIFSVFFLVRFTKKPLRFFGMVGATMLALGVLLTLYLVVDRLIFDHPLSERPALLLSSLLMVLGLQVFALGLLGELVIFTHARELRDYQVDQVIEFPADEAQPTAARERDLAVANDR